MKQELNFFYADSSRALLDKKYKFNKLNDYLVTLTITN